MSPDRPDDDPYTIDDLIADEKRQTRWVLLIFVGAVIFIGGRNLLTDTPAPNPSPAPAAPVTSQM